MAKITLVIETAAGEDVGETIAQVREALFGLDTVTVAVKEEAAPAVAPYSVSEIADAILERARLASPAPVEPVYTHPLVKVTSEAKPVVGIVPFPGRAEGEKAEAEERPKRKSPRPIKTASTEALKEELSLLIEERGKQPNKSARYNRIQTRIQDVRKELEKRGEGEAVAAKKVARVGATPIASRTADELRREMADLVYRRGRARYGSDEYTHLNGRIGRVRRELVERGEPLGVPSTMDYKIETSKNGALRGRAL